MPFPFRTTLNHSGTTKQILEKSLSGEDDGGADLALWPAATKILKEFGVGSTEPAENDEFVDLSDFWGRKTYPVRCVRICKVENERESPTSPRGAPAADVSTAKSGAGGGGSTRSGLSVAAPEAVLTKVNMDAVVDGEGEPFRLVGRQAVMAALLPLVDKDSVRRGVRVVRAEQSVPPGETMATAHVAGGDASAERVDCRVLVGADGIHSVCRVAVSAAAAMLPALRDGTRVNPSTSSGAAPTAVRAADARDGGEVCYRGVLDLREGSPAAEGGLRAMFEEDEERRPTSMAVVYGDHIRFSWGFIDGARETGYWFVKQLTGGKERQDARSLGQGWPEPLRTFVELTGEACSYAHRIQDRPPLDRYTPTKNRTNCNITRILPFVSAGLSGGLC